MSKTFTAFLYDDICEQNLQVEVRINNYGINVSMKRGVSYSVSGQCTGDVRLNFIITKSEGRAAKWEILPGAQIQNDWRALTQEHHKQLAVQVKAKIRELVPSLLYESGVVFIGAVAP